MNRAQWVFGALAGVVVAACSHAAPAERSAPRESLVPANPVDPVDTVDTIACDEVIDAVDAPPGSERGAWGYVTAGGAAALPPGPLQAHKVPDGTPARGGRARGGLFFAKVGLLVRAGATVDIAVPEGATHRLEWGWSVGPSTHLRFPGCRGVGPANTSRTGGAHAGRDWVVFAGGLYAREPACVDVVVRQGERRDVLRVGVGTACAPP